MLHVAPILNRELITFLRRGRAFWGLLGFVALFCFLTMTSYVEFAIFAVARGSDAISRRLFLTCSYLQLVVFALLAMILTSGVVSSERASRTLDLLLTTPLRTTEILTGKVYGAVGYLVLLLIAVIPVYSLCFLLGGVGWKDLGFQIYLTMLMALTYGMIGAALSASSRRKPTRQHSGVLIVVLLLNGGIPLLVLLVGTLLGQKYGWWDPGTVDEVAMAVFIVCSPIGMLRCWTSPFWAGAGWPIAPTTFLLCHTAVQLGFFFLFLWLGCRTIRREATIVRKKPRRFRFWVPGLFPISNFVNPVAAKDILLCFPKGKLGSIALALVLGGLFGLCAWGLIELRAHLQPGDAVTFYKGAVLTVLGLVGLLVFLRASGVVASETEAGTQGLLAATPLKPLAVMAGKLQAVIASIGAVTVLLSFGLSVLFCLLYPSATLPVLTTIPAALICLIATCAMYGAVGIWISAGARTVRSASNRVGLLVLAVLFIGGPIMSTLFGVLGFSRSEVAITVVGNGLLAVLFPAPLALMRDDLPGHGEKLWWVFFFGGLLLSLIMAWLWLAWAGWIYNWRLGKDEERRSTA